MKPGRVDADYTVESDYTFVFGDLNYRVDEEYDETVKQLAEGRKSELWGKDQLNGQRSENHVLSQFTEGELNFLPTYRIERYSDEWSNKKNQPPSWTDRILIRAHRFLDISAYEARHECIGSDHRPVVGSYVVSIRSWFMPPTLPSITEDPMFAIIELMWLEVVFDCEICLLYTSDAADE